MKFYIADAFSETLFGGNPAGVVIIPLDEQFPSETTMIKVAAELRYSETAFVQQLSKFEFKIRYFTPAGEVDLCGHATIATFVCLLDAKLASNGSVYTCHTKLGIINVKTEKDFVMMDMAPAVLLKTISSPLELDRLYECMGSEYGGVTSLPVMIVSTGLPDIMLPISSLEELNGLNPDRELLTKISRDYNVTGVHAFTLETSGDETAHCRNFAPLYDIDEEAATGTSNGALTYYLYINDKIKQNATCKMIQGEAMNRPSTIITSLNDRADSISQDEPPAQTYSKTKNCEIKVGGSAVILASGDINI